MKKMNRFLKTDRLKVTALVLFALLFSGKSPAPDIPRSRDSFSYLREHFASPGKEYGSAPLWVWHTKVTKTIIDSMMTEFKANAFGGVMVHPRPGLVTEYLSPEWFDLFRYTVEKGKELGMNVWIYDENSYPTGFAGGLLQEQMPAAQNQGQMLQLNKVNLLPVVFHDLVACFIVKGNQIEDITSSMGPYLGKPGNYYLITKAYYTANRGILSGPVGFSYIDLMAEGVTEKFIDITFKGYRNVAGAEFGKTIPGIFSDEPSIPTEGPNRIRWTPDLFSTFKRQWGYDLQQHLPSLFEEVGDWKHVRHNYQYALLHLFTERWAKPMQRYAAKQGLIWTGHYWEHGWPDPQHVPDNMAMYAWFDQPGIDMLFNQFNENSPNAQFGNIRAVKELSSVANQLGKKRTLSETYGGGGWDVTFKDLKRLADWEFALGVNFMNQHLSFMTLTGARKYDYPPSFSYHSPWWPYYRDLNQYYARLSLALSSGRQENSILVLEPTTSAWMYTGPGGKNKRFYEIGSRFQDFVTTLTKAQVAYDLGSEDIISYAGNIRNGQFIVGERGYTMVVIPPGMDNLNGKTLDLLQQYLAAGGKVLGFETIKTINGKETNEPRIGTMVGYQKTGELSGEIIERHFRSDGFRIDTEGGNLFHHRRLLDDGQLLFLSNASLEQEAKGSVRIKGSDVLLLDLFTGELLGYPETGADGGFAVVDVTVPPAGSLLLFSADQKQQGLKDYLLPANGISMKSGLTEIRRAAENILTLDFCDLQIHGTDTVLQDVYVPRASNLVFRQLGFSEGAGNPWFNQTQFKQRIVERDTFSAGTGFTATYRFFVDEGVNHQKFRAVVEQGSLWSSISVNGKEIHPDGEMWWLDRAFSALEIGAFVRAGENVLTLSVDPMSIYAEIEPIYILGDFNLRTADRGWHITASEPLDFGSWNKQGLPMYAHGVIYQKELELVGGNGRYAVKLDQWKGSVAVITVNGRQAGIILAEPNTLDITDYLKNGSNRITVEVIGTLKNLLGPFHNTPGKGIAGPGFWKADRYPPGSQYDTFEYGLMNDFEIVNY
ncbi:glycosyl hydrolase [Parapedobacter tibetensis]|uniref:glycosyl hydrolase n=1 Tax=Parapedobacter tibetensis TaxID=2972951 RepID=UPI00214DB403|nr:glycosyl hydrolase [Parapedobacter tibetensis]